MKVLIKPYVNYIGPYQIADKIFWWQDHNNENCVWAKRAEKLGEWLAQGTGDETNRTWFCKLLDYIHSKRSRNIKVHIDPYDTWSMDHTLAHIITPMLKQLNKHKHGAPFVDDSDVPEELRSSNAKPKECESDLDEFHFARWDWVMGEMIWAFEQQLDDDADGKFYSFPKEKFTNLEDKLGAIQVDHEGLNKWQQRKQNGFRLFGKYYEALWD